MSYPVLTKEERKHLADVALKKRVCKTKLDAKTRIKTNKGCADLFWEIMETVSFWDKSLDESLRAKYGYEIEINMPEDIKKKLEEKAESQKKSLSC